MITLYSIPTLSAAWDGWVRAHEAIQAYLADHVWIAVLMALSGPVGIPLVWRWVGRRIRAIEAQEREAAAQAEAEENRAEREAAWDEVVVAGSAIREAWKSLEAAAKARQQDGQFSTGVWLDTSAEWDSLQDALLRYGEALRLIPAADRLEHERALAQLWLLVRSREVVNEPERYFWRLGELALLTPTLRRQ
ncbi:MAG: hypothetical protein ACLF0P_14360 [Thermoanaerobaculia bacterium]